MERYVRLTDLTAHSLSNRIKINFKKEIRKEIWLKAIQNVGSKRAFERKTGYGYRNVDLWVEGKQRTLGLDLIIKLCEYANICLSDIETELRIIKMGRGAIH